MGRCAVVCVLAVVAVACSTGPGEPQVGPVRYVYDAASRVRAVVAEGGETATYRYDAVGNILEVERFPTSQLSVIELAPGRGSEGDEVVVHGTGFAPSPGENTVAFNGTPATVTEANTGSLTVTVPVGATTGPVTVTTPAGSATGEAVFTVEPDLAPTVSGLSATVAGVGDQVTITGSNFFGDVALDAVTINAGAAPVTSSTPSELVVTVPPSATSGPVTVTTPEGTAVAGQDLFVPPEPFTAADIGFTGRTEVGDPAAVSIGTANRVGLLVFEGAAGQRVSVNVTDDAFSSCAPELRLLAPGGAQFGRLGCSLSTMTLIEPVTLPADGTYTVLVNPGSATGSATITVHDVEDVSRAVTPGGGPVTVDLPTPGQNAVLDFDATEGQRVSVELTGDTFASCSPEVRVFASAGEELGSATCVLGTLNFVDTMAIPADGTYRIEVDPTGNTTGSIGVTLHAVPPDASGALTPGGAAVTATITTPGQNGQYTFAGTAGQRVALELTGDTLASCSPEVRILGPDGAELAEDTCVISSGGEFIDTLTLPATGTYRVVVDPTGVTTGAITLRLHAVPADLAGTITPGGSAVTATIGTPGQNGQYTFAGTAGQRVALELTSDSFSVCSPEVRILAPDGAELAEDTCVASNDFLDTLALPAAGTYRVVVDPTGATTGAITLRLHNVPADVSGTITAGGPAVPVTIATPGQNGALTFAGTAGQRVSLEVTADSFASCSPRVRIVAPGGSAVAEDTCISAAGELIDTLALPAAGTYRVEVDPTGATTGAITLRLHNVPPDVSGTVTVGGPAVPVTIGTPGQNANLTFAGAAGQNLNVALTSDTFAACSPVVRVYRPDGTELASRTCVQGSNTLPLGPLPVAGTYRILVDPTAATTGAVAVALTPGTAAAPEGAPQADATGSTRGDDDAPAPGPDAEPAADAAADADAGEPPLLEPAEGVTAVSGRVVGLDGRPLAGVTLSVHGQGVLSDATGRFLLELEGLRSGTYVLGIDGRSADTADASYGTFEAGIDVAEGFPTFLEHTIWMPELDTEHMVELDYPLTEDVVVTTPEVPGLELHIPAGSVIRDEAGQPVTEVGITPIPVDRTPFPLPEGSDVPIYFTVQPGGAVVGPEGARLVYPNYNDETPGAWLSFMQYCPEAGGRWEAREEDCPEAGWHVYGRGTVTPDGAQVTPDAGVSIYEFSGAMINAGGYLPPGFGPNAGDGSEDGDPVDLGTGLFVYEKTDLAVADLLPIPLTRTYRQGDDAVRAFGVGATWSYDLYLWSAEQYQEADLILADGSRIHYDRVSAGTGFADAVFEDTGSPTVFNDSRLAWNGDGWDLRLKDGTTFVFGDEAPLQSIRDRHGNEITVHRQSRNVYGAETGNIVSIRSPSGRYIGFSYDDANRVSEARDHTGRSVTYTYDDGGRLATVTDPAGGVTAYTYDAAHRMLTITDPRGITYLTNEYDAAGRVSRQTQADGSSYGFAYVTDTGGAVTQAEVTDPRGVVRRVGFDGGYRVSDTAAVGTPQENTVTVERSAGSHLVTAATDELGRRTTYAYDESGDLTSVTSLAGTPGAVTTSFTYEPEYHQVATITDPLDRVTTYAYDDAGDVDSVTDPAGAATTFGHDAQGRLTSVTDPVGATSSYAYTALNRVRSTDPAGNVSDRFIDASGRPVLMVDPLGNRTTFGYDALNRLTSTTDPLQGETLLAHDANGNLTSVTDARGNATTFAYDDLDRMVSRTDPLGASDTLAYDQGGNLTRRTDRRGLVTAYAYDPLGRAVTAAYGQTATGAEATVTSTYDAGGRVTRIEDSASGVVTRAYDLQDRLTRETTSQGEVAYTYDAAGQRLSMTIDGGAQSTFTYDDAGRVASVTRGGLAATTTRDGAGRVTRATLPNGVTVDYGYDVAGRPTSIDYAAGGTNLGGLTYGYDPLERRVTIGGDLARTNLPAAMPSATYDAANRVTAWAGTAFTYDASGNITGDGTATYTWDARGRLTAVGGPGPATFGYDSSGRRTSHQAGGVTTTYLYDGANLVRESAGGSETSYLTGLGLDEALARTDADGTSTYLRDALGSTVGLVDDTGALGPRYSYDPFGATQNGGVEDGNRLRFTGREDDGNGLYYYRARYYRPDLGRFISEDPLGHAAGDPNLYAYVGNSPTNAVDPSGLCGVDAVVDGGFLVYDAYALFRDGRKNLGTNLLAGIADIGGLLLPCATGGGAAVRAGRAADDAIDAVRSGSRHLDNGDDIVVIGRRHDTAVASDWPGHTILDVPNDAWTIQLNDEFIEEAIAQRRTVYLGSPETPQNMWDADRNSPTVFAREVEQLLDAGYTRHGDYLIPPGG